MLVIHVCVFMCKYNLHGYVIDFLSESAPDVQETMFGHPQ